MPVTYQTIDEVGIITINNPPVNALSNAVRAGLQSCLREALADDVSAVIVACDGRTFVAGADIREFGLPPEPPILPDLLNEIESSPKPIIAAIHGTALGGGFELALACHYRCALQSARVGLPEVHLGLLPGAGGTQRTPRLAGGDAAVELMVGGNPVIADKALQLGLLDRVATTELRAAAVDYAQELIRSGGHVRRSSELRPIPMSETGRADIEKTIERRARGQNAPKRIVEAVASSSLPFAEGTARERALFMECMHDPQSAAMRHLFFAEREAAKIDGIDKQTATRAIASAGVIGAGTMGAGIAVNFANAGIPVTIIEMRDEALQRGLGTIDKIYAGSVKRGKLDRQAADERRALISGALDLSELGAVDLVVEAVFEDPAIKVDIFSKLDAICKPGAILATNTSYQDVNAIAAATSRPMDVVGLHFFSPAHIMKLLEVVRADKTADDVLATCMALARRIAKVPVMSGVCYGFIGNRMLIPYMREAQLCLLEGASAQAIDQAMVDWGMAMGPLSVADLAGLDVSYKARQAQPRDKRGDPRDYRIADALVEAGRLGRKSSCGFYDYDSAGRPSAALVVDHLAEQAAAEFGVTRRTIEPAEIVDRLILALANEGLKVLDEGIAQRAGDIDVVYAYGYGFPRWRGGPMHYADSIGLAETLARIETFQRDLSETNWKPAALLCRLVDEGRNIADL